MKTLTLTSAFLLLSWPVLVAAQSLDTAKIDEALGRSGQKSAMSTVSASRAPIFMSRWMASKSRPGLALGSWAPSPGRTTPL